MESEKTATRYTNSQLINFTALYFSSMLLLSALVSAIYTGESIPGILNHLKTILTEPCPLVTDYFRYGSMSAAFFNAAACGISCTLFMFCLKEPSTPVTLAGYFLVVAHCFYGLNFLNMWPCFIAPMAYIRLKKLNLKANLHICMFATSFAPFVSELLFRYTNREGYVFGNVSTTPAGIALAFVFCLLLAFVVPAILPGASEWHKGYNLYNGGLAFGIFGFFVYNFMYKTMGVHAPAAIQPINTFYQVHDYSYRLYANLFYSILFGIIFIIGYRLNGKSAKGLDLLLKDTGFRSDFATRYGMPVCMMNIGIYGFFFLAYLNLVISYTSGAGFTGPTFGIILAALTFTAMGQHPRNIWPILAGYMLLYLFTMLICHMSGREIGWSISTQGYLNGVAFATGLSPIVGRYGARAGIASGFLCASMCTATSALHGGFVLYNGGFTAGITALIMVPILEHYVPAVRENIKNSFFDIDDVIKLHKHVSESLEHDEFI